MKFSDQVITALRELHPGVRRDIRRALDAVNEGKRRDVRALSEPLTGFWRLRVGKYRVVFRRDARGELIAEYLAPRESVYQSFQPPSGSD